MKTLTSLGITLIGAGVFFTALLALGIACVLGVGMAAAACDFAPTHHAATASGAAAGGEPVLPPRGTLPVSWSPPSPYLASTLDWDPSTTEMSPPGSVPVL